MSRTRKQKKLDRLADPVIARIGAEYDLDHEDRERIRTAVRHGAAVYRRSNSKKRQPFRVYLDEMTRKLSQAYASEYSRKTVGLGPTGAHMLFSICPLWPFC